MKIIGKLAEWALFILIGFWVATSGILNDTWVGPWLNEIMDVIPRFVEERSLVETDENSSKPTFHIPNLFKSSEIDVEFIEEKIFTLTNELRAGLDVPTLQRNEQLAYAANIRAVETEELFSHTRPDGSDAVTVLSEEGVAYTYRMFGENLAYGTFLQDESYMAELLFNGWVNSEGHYQNMIQPEFEEIGIGVHFDGEFLYLTQIFGAQQ